MPTDEEDRTLEKVAKEWAETLNKHKKRIDELEAQVTELRQTKKEAAPAPAPAPPAEDPIRAYVLRLKDEDEARRKAKEARTKVRTREEVDKEAAGVLSRMLKKTQEE